MSEADVIAAAKLMLEVERRMLALHSPLFDTRGVEMHELRIERLEQVIACCNFTKLVPVEGMGFLVTDAD